MTTAKIVSPLPDMKSKRLTHISTTNSSSRGITLQETENGISRQTSSSNHWRAWCHSKESAHGSNVQSKEGRVEEVSWTRDSDWLRGHAACELKESHNRASEGYTT